MSRAARILVAAAALVVATAAPAAAQSARATLTASATVVEPIGFAAGASTVAAARGAIDVTTPVSVRGRAAHVVQVFRSAGGAPSAGATLGGGIETQANGATSSAYHVRLRLARAAAAAGPWTVTYVVSTLN